MKRYGKMRELIPAGGVHSHTLAHVFMGLKQHPAQQHNRLKACDHSRCVVTRHLLHRLSTHSQLGSAKHTTEEVHETVLPTVSWSPCQTASES